MPAPPGLGVITLDTDLRIRSWNDWLVAATAIPHADAVGRPLTEFLGPSRLPVLREELAGVLQTGTTRMLAPALHQFLIRCPPPQPNPFFQEMQQCVIIAPLRDEAGIVGIMVTIEDVTMRMVSDRTRSAVSADPLRDAVVQSGAEDWRVRAEAIRTLRRRATESQVAQLIEVLQRDHDNFSVLSGALQVLVAVDGSVTAPLVALLDDPSPNVRMHAALALGAVGDREGVPALLRALHDADSNVRFHAIEALGRLAAPEAVDGLRAAAASGDFFLAFPAIDALARIDDPAVVPALIPLLGQDELRPAVIEALAALGDEDCVGMLTELLNQGREDTTLVATALSRIAQRYDQTCGSAGVIVDAFRISITPDGVERLAAAMRSQTGPSLAVIAVLGWVGAAAIRVFAPMLGQGPFQDAVTQAVSDMGPAAVPELISQLQDGPRDAKIASASLLGAIGEARSAPALVDALDSHDAELVSAAARALAALGQGVSLESLLPLFGHPEVTVRHAAMAAVNANALGSAVAATRWLQLIRDSDAHVRECAIRTAGYLSLEGCGDGIRQAVDDEIEDVRRAAIEQLPLFEHERSLTLLLRALVRETPRNRAAAAHALRLVDDAAATSALLEALGDSDPWVRYFAVGSLAHRGTTAAGEVLEAMALVDPAPQVRIAALSALGVLSPAALVRLVPMTTADADETVAGAAVRALSPGSGGEAEPLLDQALRSEREAVQTAAAAALGGFPTVFAVQALAWAARLEHPSSLAPTAIESLRQIADTAAGVALAVPALLELSIDPARRELIIQVLSELSTSAVPTLAEQLASPHSAVRVVVVEALARMCHTEATAHLATALTDPSATVRAAAVTAFGRLGSSSIGQTMVALSQSDPDAGVRRRAATVCRRYGWTPASADPGIR